ncbi:MAG: helix-turn-helix domain-containing protein, partial [Chloroflexi bacterium]
MAAPTTSAARGERIRPALPTGHTAPARRRPAPTRWERDRGITVSAAWSRYIRETLDERTDLSSRARHLLDRLGHHVNGEGICWPSVDTLARQMGVTASTVQRARAELVAAGVITIIVTAGRGHSNLYAFPEWSHPRDHSAGEKVAPTREKVAPTRRNGRTHATQKYPRSIQEGPRVAIANGFALDAIGPVD